MAEKMTLDQFTTWAQENLSGDIELDGAEYIKQMFPKQLHLVTKEMCAYAGEQANTDTAFDDINLKLCEMMGISNPDDMGDDASESTNEFSEDGDAKPVKGGKKGATRHKNLPRRAANKVIIDTARQLGTTTYGAVATIISQRGAVVGYVTATNEKIDIVKKTQKVGDTGRSETRFMARMSGPSGCKAYIVAVPANAFHQIEMKLEGTVDADHLNVDTAQDPNQPYILKAYPTDSFVSMFLTSIACGSIKEADELYTPYVMKSRAGKDTKIVDLPSLEAVNANVGEDDAIVAGKNALYTTTSYKKDPAGFQTPITRVKHTFRTKLVTPDNYISARIYKTIPIEATYSPEECARYTEAYLGKFITRQFKGGSLIDTVPADENNITFTTTANGTPEISSNRFFTTSADNSYWADTMLDHWFYREPDGNPKKVKPLGLDLVKKEAFVTKKGTTQVKLAYKDLKAEPGVDNYTLDFGPGGRHEKIGKAANAYGVQITYDFMEELFRSASLIKDPNRPAKTKEKAAPNPRGRYAFGISTATASENYKQALQAALQSAKAAN